MRKKLSAAAGLVTIAAAGALITSSPAIAESDLASTAGVAAVAGPASATVANQLGSVQERANTRAGDRRRRHRHRRHHRRHRRHHRRHHRMY